MIKVIMFLFMLFALSVHAGDMQQKHREGDAFAKSLQTLGINSSQTLDTSILPDYFTQTPPESSLNAVQLSNGASNEASQTVFKSFEGRPRFEIDTKNDPAIKNAISITGNPNSIVGEQNCSTVPVECETTYSEHTCEEALHFKEQACEKSLVASVHQPPVVNKIIDVALGVYAKDDNVYIIDLKTGDVKVTGDKAGSVIAEVRLNEKLDTTQCPSLSIQQHSMRLANVGNVPGSYSTHKVQIAVIEAPSCQNNLIGKFLLKKKGKGKWRKRGAIFKFRIQYQPPKEIKREYWQNDCASLENNVQSSLCKVINEECVDGPSTKNISGLNVHKACWKKKLTFECAHAQNQNNCGVYRQRGCEQINSTCKERTASGLCAVFQQTYRCVTKTCSKETKTICGGKPFCKDGDCTDTSYSPNQDFNKAISHLALLNNSGKDFDSKLSQVFKGKSCGCRDAFANFRNCCKDKGWGLDLSLAECNSEEKELGQKKESGLCHYVDRYCSKEVLGKCVEKKKSYCCFGSKLARIVHEQGRAQLGLGWGDGEHPNCTGLIPEQLQQLDFSKMDLSEFYADVQKQAVIPNTSQTTHRIKERIDQFYRGVQ